MRKVLSGYFFLSTACTCIAVLLSATHGKSQQAMDFSKFGQVAVGGVLGDALNRSEKGRLTALPTWNNGELITMFSKAARAKHDKMDWYGEHAGKWMLTAARAAARTGDSELKKLVLQTADYLVDNQEDDGYMGSYGPNIRFTNSSAMHQRSWDVWNMSYMTLGLLEVNHYFPQPKYAAAATKIGELFIKTFMTEGHDITDYGTRHGISATIVLEPVVELYRSTSDARYLQLARTIVDRMEAREGVKFIEVARKGGDMENVGDGKAYQILWNLTALAKLYEVTKDENYLQTVEYAWKNIAEHHLTITGGPWGGIGKHLECFNRRYYWSPYGFVETCSTMSWIQLNKELLRITGQPRYAQEIERAAYNALLGAQYENGVDWSYHTFSNGKRHIAHFNDCCPSSGALALEELPEIIYSHMKGGLAVNLFAPGSATTTVGNRTVNLKQETNYPLAGAIRIHVSVNKPINFPLQIRIPDWATSATVSVNGEKVEGTNIEAGSYCTVEREWKKETVIELTFPLEMQVAHRSERVGAPQGGAPLFDVKWFAFTRGPLVYATEGLIDGKDRERVINMDDAELEKRIKANEPREADSTEPFVLKVDANDEVRFVPYYKASGENGGSWRLTWLQKQVQ